MTAETFVLIGIVAFVAAGIVIAAALGFQRRRSERLDDQLEQDERAAGSTPDDGEVQPDLWARQEGAEDLPIRPLTRATHHRFSEEWASVQELFAEDPEMAVEQADGLSGDVMRARGYPVGDFERRAADVAVRHPGIVEHYRRAHAVAMADRDGAPADADALQQAFGHYRALFAELLEAPNTELRNAEPMARPRRAS